ncbi:hypothetical protein [Arsenophonus sp.]|uniref:hypothetical protein n=1 Tax=Arsenophonus sp. TaxID=1872640 RepID=UPI00387953C8
MKRQIATRADTGMRVSLVKRPSQSHCAVVSTAILSPLQIRQTKKPLAKKWLNTLI